MAISISVDQSGVVGDLRYVLATATYDDADTAITVSAADFGLSVIYSITPSITSGLHPVAYVAGELVPFNGPGSTAGPLVEVATSVVDAETASIFVLGQ